MAEAEAYEKAHPKEVAEAKAIGKASGKALASRQTKMTATGSAPKRQHRKTGGKRGRPKGGVAAIARKHGKKPLSVQQRIRRGRAIKTSTDLTSKKPRKITCPGCGLKFEVKR